MAVAHGWDAGANGIGRATSNTDSNGHNTWSHDPLGPRRANRPLVTIDEPWGRRTYGYDNADRLASETGWAGSHSYSWDANANRQSQSGPLGGTGYSYEPGSNRLQSATGVDARGFTHDAAGNQTAEGGFGYGYDARNRLSAITSPTGSTSYAHDALGRRVLKSSPVQTRYYAHDEQRKVIGEYDATSTLSETVWLGSTPVAVLRNGQTYWIDADHLDTPRAVLNASNQIVWRWRSEAFGNTEVEDNPSGLGTFEFNHRLPGQMFDAETALHHNDHRDYRAHTGRYAQADPIGLDGGLNRFGYVGGNPLSYTDPEGLWAVALAVCPRRIGLAMVLARRSVRLAPLSVGHWTSADRSET